MCFAIIVIERAARGVWIVGGVHREGIREINVDAAVIVVIKKSDPAADRLDDVFFLRRGVWRKAMPANP